MELLRRLMSLMSALAVLLVLAVPQAAGVKEYVTLHGNTA